jgi:hypothetical protein
MAKSQGDRFDKLLRIAVSYQRQAEKCSRVKAYHASSILLASAVEGLILAMYYCFDSQARRSNTYQSVRKRKTNILYWDLFELVSLARELNWISSTVYIGRSNYSISQAVNEMRKTRNTIHPGNYIRTRRGKLVGASDFKQATRIFQACVDSLEAAL